MRILITGVTSGLGRLAAGHLAAAGHHVTGVAEHQHPDLDPRVEALYGSLNAPGLGELTDAADAVVHLAPVEPGVPESAGLTGVVHIANAAARSGTRLLVPIHAAGDPELYRQAEELVTSSWGPTLVIRLAPVVGRLPDWTVCRTVATLLDTGHGRTGTVRLLHTDDLCRFLVHAMSTDGDGHVDLATTHPVTYVSARRLMAPVRVQRRPTDLAGHRPAIQTCSPASRLGLRVWVGPLGCGGRHRHRAGRTPVGPHRRQRCPATASGTR